MRLFPLSGTFRSLALASAFTLGLGVSLYAAPGAPASAGKKVFGTMPNGATVDIYTISNSHGMQARVMTYGATLVSLRVPDAHGHIDDVILGFDDLNDYLTKSPYFGATIGRYGNRINHGTFTLDGHTYHIPMNEKTDALHGGPQGFDKRIWTVKESTPDSVELAYRSADGEEGFPGNLDVTVRYTVTPDNSLRIDYSAVTDKPTVLNLTNHTYFNLDGQGKGTIDDQEIRIDADSFTPIDANLIPTGEIRPVSGTPLDFRTMQAIGSRLNDDYDQLKYAGGYDFNWVLNKRGPHTPVVVAWSPATGRVLEMFTDQPGVQFYTSNMLQGPMKGKEGRIYEKRGAFTLETQHFPDSPNHPNFPSTVLRPGQHFHSSTTYHFTVRHNG